ncbi:MAG: N2,N2-dimethylguanosine tRNA methyltransferase [Ferroplasma sp.]
MERKNQYNIISEGEISIEAPDIYFTRGPGSRTAGFYNMDQKLNRDITISFLKAVKPKLALDAFGGTGIRGLRIEKEAGVRTVISELNKKSFQYIEENKALNGSNAEIYRKSFQAVLNDYLFDYIDIDPYGSVLPYLDDTIMNLRNRGYFGVTATDLTALTGSMPVKTKRRYNARIINDTFRHESGIRLLISAVVQRAAAMDIAAMPMLSLWHSHYYRVIFRIQRSASMADNQLENIGLYNRNISMDPLCNNYNEGPLWLGKLNSYGINNLKLVDNPDKLLLKYMERMANDDLSLYFMDLAETAQLRGRDSISINSSIKLLEESGIKAGRTQFSETGIKVDGAIQDAIKILY